MLQLAGSPHAWLEARGPRLTLLAAIDDATGVGVGALGREQEDSQGDLGLLAQIATTVGCRVAVDPDRAGSFVHHAHEHETRDEFAR